MANNYIGSTKYVDSADKLTSDFGFNGDIAFVVETSEDDEKSITGQYTKYDGEWISVSGASASSSTTPLDNVDDEDV
jgi:hypothetical protein